MAVVGTICVRCKKVFDFELYAGLCPHCGCFHRQPGVSLNGKQLAESPKTVVKPEHHTIEADYERHMKMDELMGKDHYSSHKTTAAASNPRAAQARANQHKYTKTSGSGEVKKASGSFGFALLRLFIVIVFILSVLSSSGIDVGYYLRRIFYELEFFIETLFM